jgi:hypothetical protein
MAERFSRNYDLMLIIDSSNAIEARRAISACSHFHCQ